MRLGIDIGGTKTAIGLFTDSGELKKQDKLSSLSFDTDRLADAVKALIGDAKIDSCGIGIPGTVSADGKKIIKAPNLGLPDDLCERLEAKLGVPCRLVQDSRAGAYGEYLLGAGVGSKCLICVTLGTGIGTGIVLDGKIYNGALGAAGELGHVPAPGKSEGRGCGCGKLDCVEKYAAGGGLDISARALFGEGATARELFDAAKNGNESASRVISEAAEILGQTFVAAVNLLSPDCLMFSGGLSEQQVYLDAITDYIKAHCYSSGSLPRIEKAKLGELSPLYGAAMIGESK